VVQQHAALGALVVAADVGLPRGAGDDHRDAVEGFVVGVKSHRCSLFAVRYSLFAVRCSPPLHVPAKSEQRMTNSAPQQYRPNASTSSPATDSAVRPSIWCRWMKWTTSPSLSRANEGLDGWKSSPK